MNEASHVEVEALRAVIDAQGSRMSELRWALERILDAAEGSSALSWSGVADVARRALARETNPVRA
ncbi:MAG TPA: hypothetical protein P5114_10550 [Hyphomicrobiaceae bacterium]|nr:hypothetical protein [Hyphomicrobiaceae bacterium]